jgi:hypothetical protein
MFIMMKCGVLLEVRTEFVIIEMSFGFKGLRQVIGYFVKRLK